MRELIAQHASAHEGEMRPVDPSHQLQVGRADRAGQVVHGAAAHAQQLGLARTLDRGSFKASVQRPGPLS